MVFAFKTSISDFACCKIHGWFFCYKWHEWCFAKNVWGFPSMYFFWSNMSWIHVSNYKPLSHPCNHDHVAKWNHFFALLAHCEGNPPVSGGFPSQRPVTQSFDVFFDLRLKKRMSKQSRRRWFETPRAHFDVTVMILICRVRCGSHIGLFLALHRHANDLIFWDRALTKNELVSRSVLQCSLWCQISFLIFWLLVCIKSFYPSRCVILTVNFSDVADADNHRCQTRQWNITIFPAHSKAFCTDAHQIANRYIEPLFHTENNPIYFEKGCIGANDFNLPYRPKLVYYMTTRYKKCAI